MPMRDHLLYYHAWYQINGLTYVRSDIHQSYDSSKKYIISCSNTFFMNIATVPCSSNIWYLQQCTLYNVNNISSIRFRSVYVAKNNKFGFLNTVCVFGKQLSGMLYNFVGLRRQLFDYPRHIICLLTKNNGKTHIFFPAVTPWLQGKSLMVKLRITKNTSTTIYMGSCFNIWWRLWRIGIFFKFSCFISWFCFFVRLDIKTIFAKLSILIKVYETRISHYSPHQIKSLFELSAVPQ